MDSHNLRKLIRKYLSERPRNTIEISVWLTNQIDSANSPSDITRILESDEHITRIGTVRKSGMRRTESPVSEWAANSWVEHHERNESGQKKER